MRDPKVSKRPNDPTGVGPRFREPGKENRHINDELAIAKRIERETIAQERAKHPDRHIPDAEEDNAHE